MPRHARFTRVTFTSFSQSKPGFNPDDQVWTCFQREICPETKRLHWQGAAVFSDQKTIRQLQQWLPGAHFERMNGTCEDSKEYCSKVESAIPGTFEEHGDMPISRQGQRSDLAVAAEAMMSGGWDSVEDTQIIRYHRGLSFLRLVRGHLSTDRMVHWYYGASGTGKTRRAMEIAGPSRFITDAVGGWFDGYCGQKTVIIDDYAGGMNTSSLLRLTDRYEYRFATKGGFMPCEASVIIFTSHEHPSSYIDEERWPELKRRIHFLCEFKSGGLVLPPT